MLILVRHGETAPNVDRVLLGRADPPLTALGRRQAETLARALPAPTRVVSSPLRRARDTAAAFGTPADVDERWIEIDYGILDGEPAATASERLVSRWRDDLEYAPEGGESLAALGRRVRSACADLVEDARHGSVVVVTHVSPIKAAIAWALSVDDRIAWRMFVNDAAVTRIGIGAEGPILRSFNEHWDRGEPESAATSRPHV